MHDGPRQDAQPSMDHISSTTVLCFGLLVSVSQDIIEYGEEQRWPTFSCLFIMQERQKTMRQATTFLLQVQKVRVTPYNQLKVMEYHVSSLINGFSIKNKSSLRVFARFYVIICATPHRCKGTGQSLNSVMYEVQGSQTQMRSTNSELFSLCQA
ncbi:hypothetical protein N7504_002703 [Penicillium tannophilum]|nr:hypothetical protein N7504_002703 [Penicillium tannophilum]